jgi:hypothetical protein
MKSPTDDRFGRGWSAFVEEDAAADAPPSVERRLRRAVAARVRPLAPAARRRPWRQIVATAGVAASLGALALLEPWSRPRTSVEAPRQEAGAPARPAAPGAAADASVPERPGPAATVEEPPRRVTRRPVDRGRATGRVQPAPGRGEVTDGPLQMIRVRIDAAALGGLGVQLAGPAPEGLVDVDLVVGVDGWPRDVRRIRPVVVEAMPE